MADTVNIYIERETPVRAITIAPTGARGPQGDQGEQGETGAAGPNSVTSATTSDGTATLNTSTLTTGTLTVSSSGVFNATSYTFGPGAAAAFKAGLAIMSADVGDATSAATANSVVTRDASAGAAFAAITATTLTASSFVRGLTLRASRDGGTTSGIIRATNITTSTVYELPETIGANTVLARTASNDGIPDAITNGTISGTVTFGTGAAANMRTALFTATGVATALGIAANGSGGFVTDTGTVTLTNKTLTDPVMNQFTLSGNISAAAWTTNGIRIKGVASTLTDTTSTGTVAVAYTNAFGGNTIAATNSVTYTNYITSFFRDPTAGTNVTFTNRYALGAESARFGTSNQVTITNAGVLSATSPIFTTPALGTPSSATLTNATGLPISTGVSGLATGAATFLATPTSANLAALLTDETGTGANVFATSPTITTPTISGAMACESINAILSQNAATRITVNNANTGTSALADLVVTAANGVGGSNGFAMQVFGSGYTPTWDGLTLGKYMRMRMEASNMLGMIFTTGGANPIFFGTADVRRMTIAGTGEIGMGTTSPSTAAVLDVSSTTKGFLPPRMTTAQRNAITSPPAGLMIYNTNTNKLNVYTTAWEAVTSA